MHAFPSSHAAVLLVKTHPEAGLQLSDVQLLLSLQVTAAPPWQVPPPQVSSDVHAFPSSHAAVLSVKTQPVAGLQLSDVHTLWSSQESVPVPDRQTPFEHVSPVVQAFPSSQAAVLSVKTQPLTLSQMSDVQGLPSSHTSVPAPGWQLPLEQASFVVQGFPSSQAMVLFV